MATLLPLGASSFVVAVVCYPVDVLRALKMSGAGGQGVTPQQFYAKHGLRGRRQTECAGVESLARRGVTCPRRLRGPPRLQTTAEILCPQASVGFSAREWRLK